MREVATCHSHCRKKREGGNKAETSSEVEEAKQNHPLSMKYIAPCAGDIEQPIKIQEVAALPH